MSPTESPSDPQTQSESGLPAAGLSPPSGPQDETEAVLAALDEAEEALDADEQRSGPQLDTTLDVIEILDAEPILTEDEPLAGAPDPIDLITRRAKNETARDRITFYEEELSHEEQPPKKALLQHEIAVQLEQSMYDDGDVSRAYALALSTDASLRPNLWALRRLFSQRSQWPSVLKLLDTEAKHAPTRRERAELWTEKGHILEDLLTEPEEAIICYQTAHELDPQALAPLAALEKILVQHSAETGRPSAELLTVYRGLTSATRDPGRRVALLIELARYEEDVLHLDQPGHSGDLDRVLAYLHDAYDVGIDQMRVIDEIVRLTASFGRIPDCLAALEVKAEILEMQAQNATPQRQTLLFDQVVAIRRWQSALARKRLNNSELSWQYLDKAYQRSPGDPLIMPELMALAEAQGRYDQLADLLAQLEETHRLAHGEESPPLGLWLKRAVALRLAGQDAIADAMEQTIAAYTPAHLLLLLARQRRLMRQQDQAGLALLLRDEAQLALDGLCEHPGDDRQSDFVWAVEALLNASACALSSGDPHLAQEALAAASQIAKATQPSRHELVQRHVLHEAYDQLYRRTGQWAELSSLYEQRLASGLWATEPLEAQRLQEALVNLNETYLDRNARALEMLKPLCAAMPDDARLRRRAAQIGRRSGDGNAEEAALAELERIDQQLELGGPLVPDLLRRAELRALAGDSAAAVALYEQVLRLRPGDPEALDAVEQLLRRSNRKEELAALLRQQIDAAAAAAQRDSAPHGDAPQRLLSLQAALADVLENELGQPGRAVPVYRSMLSYRPGYYPAIRAIERLHRRAGDVPKQIAALEELAEALPSNSARAAVQVRLAELFEDEEQQPAAAAEAFSRAFHSMPLPTPVAAHPALGRLRVLMRQRSYGGLGEALEAFEDTLLSEEPLRLATSAILSEERAYWGARSGTGVALERSESLLNKALQEIRQAEPAALPYPELIPLLEWGRCRIAQQRGDGKQQGNALAALAAHLTQLGDREPRAAVGELWLRAGLLGTLNEDEHGQQVETGRRLLQAYRLLGDVPEVVVPLCDLLEDLSLTEPLAREPEIIPLLRARQALCSESEVDDRLVWTLLEAEVWLMRCESPDESMRIDDATRARNAQEAAEAALRALALDPQSLMALLLLRQATAPAAAEVALDARALPPNDPAAPRLRAYALYTLRLADLLSQPQAKAELYSEAAQIFLRLGDTDAAAASLRTLLDNTPEDATAFGQLHSLLSARAEDPQHGDAGPLVELLNFRLGLKVESESHRKSEQPLRVSLLLQRAGLFRNAGKISEAIADLQELLAFDPQHGLAHRRLAELLTQAGMPDDAIRHYERFLQIDTNPAERSAVHIAVARLLSATIPSRAATHVRHAIDLGHKYRGLRGHAVESPEEVGVLVELYRWLEQLHLSQGQSDAAVATLRELEGHIPSGASFSEERQLVALEIATVLEKHQRDSAAASEALEKVAAAEPLALKVLDRLLGLSQAAGASSRVTALYGRAIDEARRQIGEQVASESALPAAPFEALAQIFAWQKNEDGRRLAAQAAAVLSGGSEKPPARKMLGKPLSSPLRSAAFTAEARGILYELWGELAESATRLLAPSFQTLGTDARERLNAKQVPPVWATVDELAHKFGMGTNDRPYGLYLSRERDLCQLSGHYLICGSSYSSTLSEFQPGLYFRLLRKLALLPDRLGPVDGDADKLLQFFASCCQLAQVPGPTLEGEVKARLDLHTKALDRALSRKERGALRTLSPQLHKLAGDEGRQFVLAWQQEILQGSAQLALAISGNVQAALTDLGVGPNDSDAASAKRARRLLAFSVSADILTLRRDFGVASE